MGTARPVVVLGMTVAFALTPAAVAADCAAPTDLYGDPLPPGAVARFGTIHLRAEADALAISPDGKTLVTAGRGVVREWDAETGKAGPVHRVPGPAPTRTFLSPDGKTLATWGGEGLALWDAATGERLHKLPLDEGHMITQAAFSPDGRTLATAEYAGDGAIRLWNVADGKGRLLAEHGAYVTALAFAPDGKRLAAAAGRGDGALRCWDAADGKELWRAKVEEANHLAFSPDGRTLASARYGGDVAFYLWDAETGRPAERGKPPAVRDVRSVRFGPDADTLAVATSDAVLVWDLKAGKERRQFPGASGPLAFSPDGKTLTALVGATVQRWNLATGEALYADTSSLGHQTPVQAVAYSADGKLLATVAVGDGVRIWDVATRKALHVLPAAEGHPYGGAWAAFAPDGATLATAALNAPIRFWDVRKGEEARRLEAPKATSIRLSLDGKTLFTVEPDPDPTGQAAIFGVGGTGTLTIWDAATGKQRARRTVQNPRASDVFSADGRWMAVEGGSVYETATGDSRLTLKADHGIGMPFGDAFAFSNDGALVAGALWESVTDGVHHRTEPRGIQVWELATGAPVARIPTKDFCRFGFAPDGRTLATVSPEVVGLWDVVAARELYTQTVADHLLGPYGSTFAFAPDGRSLAVAATDTTVPVWDLSPAFRDAPAAAPLKAEETDALWADLAGADAAKAYAAVNRLVARPADAVPLLRDRLHAAAPIPAEKLQRQIADLDDDDLTVRDAATRDMAALGAQAAPALRDALTYGVSPEQRRRIESLLEGVHVMRPGDGLRGVRAVRVLERIDSADCRRILDTLSAGDRAAPLTQEARDTVARLAARN